VAAVAGLALTDHRALRGTYSHTWYTYPAKQENLAFDYAGAAKIIADGYRPGDSVADPRWEHWWIMLDVGVDYYLPASVHPRDAFRSETAAENGNIRAAECVSAEMCLGTAQRLWVVAPTEWSMKGANPLNMFMGDQVAAISQHYRPTTSKAVHGVTVVLFQRTG
jgi:mannosyltransferase